MMFYRLSILLFLAFLSTSLSAQDELAFGFVPTRPDSVWADDPETSQILVRVELKEDSEDFEKPIIRDLPHFQADFDEKGRPIEYRYFDLKGDLLSLIRFEGWDEFRTEFISSNGDTSKVEHWILEGDKVKSLETNVQDEHHSKWTFRYDKNGRLRKAGMDREYPQILFESEYTYTDQGKVSRAVHATRGEHFTAYYFVYSEGEEQPSKVIYVDANQMEVVRRRLGLTNDQVVQLNPQVFVDLLEDPVFVGHYKYDEKGRTVRYFTRKMPYRQIATVEDFFDEEGRVTKRSYDWDESYLETEFEYDDEGRVIAEKHYERVFIQGKPLMGPRFTRRYRYDKAGRLKELVFTRRRDRITFTETYRYEYIIR